MIDTLSWTCSIPYLPDRLVELQSLFPNRKSTNRSKTKGSCTTSTRHWSLPLIGIRLSSGTQNYITSIQCELPKLLYGHNGRLIRNAADLTVALRRLDSVLQFIADPGIESIVKGESSTIDKGHISRIDLVWQYNHPVSTLRGVLHNARHPRIYGGPDLFGNGNIAFQGNRFTVTIYDKMKWEKPKTRYKNASGVCSITPSVGSEVSRIELKLESKGYVAKTFGVDPKVGLKSFPFDEAYRVYRDLVLEFTNLGNHSSTSTTSLASFFASEALRDRFILERYITHRQHHPSRASALRREAQSVVLRSFDLSSLVPSLQRLKVVEVVNPWAENELLKFMTNNPGILEP